MGYYPSANCLPKVVSALPITRAGKSPTGGARPLRGPSRRGVKVDVRGPRARPRQELPTWLLVPSRRRWSRHASRGATTRLQLLVVTLLAMCGGAATGAMVSGPFDPHSGSRRVDLGQAGGALTPPPILARGSATKPVDDLSRAHRRRPDGAHPRSAHAPPAPRPASQISATAATSAPAPTASIGGRSGVSSSGATGGGAGATNNGATGQTHAAPTATAPASASPPQPTGTPTAPASSGGGTTSGFGGSGTSSGGTGTSSGGTGTSTGGG